MIVTSGDAWEGAAIQARGATLHCSACGSGPYAVSQRHCTVCLASLEGVAGSRADTSAGAKRPVSVIVVGVLLVLAAVVLAVLGALLSWVSNCCGSSDPVDSSYLQAGLAAAALLVAAAVALLAGAPAYAVLTLAAAPVLGSLWLSYERSSDYQGIATLFVLGLALLSWACRRPTWRAWFAGAAARRRSRA